LVINPGERAVENIEVKKDRTAVKIILFFLNRKKRESRERFKLSKLLPSFILRSDNALKSDIEIY
jgi:hypothetical protein